MFLCIFVVAVVIVVVLVVIVVVTILAMMLVGMNERSRVPHAVPALKKSRTCYCAVMQTLHFGLFVF